MTSPARRIAMSSWQPPMLLYALNEMYGYHMTGVGGGEAGVKAPFGVFALVRLSYLGWGSIFSNLGTDNLSGYQVYVNGDQKMLYVGFEGKYQVVTPVYPSDINRIWLFGFSLQASRLYSHFNGITLDVSANATTYVLPTTGKTCIATRTLENFPGPMTEMLGMVSFRGTLAQSAADAMLASTRSTGSLPTSIAGVTVTHRMMVNEQLDQAGAPVVDGQPAPAMLSDSVTGAAVDEFVTHGTSTIKVIDAAAPMAWSWDAKPILIGAEVFTLSDYWAAAVNALPGDASGFTVSVLCCVRTRSVASATRRLFSQRSAGNAGWDMSTTGTNGAVVFGVGGTNAVASPSAPLVATDLQRLQLFTGVFDGANARLYAKKLQVGSGAALAGGYASTAVAPMIGRRDAGTPAVGMAIFGVSYAVGVPTLEQIQAQFDDVLASERMRPIDGLPGVWLDFTEDAAGSALPPTLTDRGAGGVDFAKIGSPGAAPHCVRSFVW